MEFTTLLFTLNFYLKNSILLLQCSELKSFSTPTSTSITLSPKSQHLQDNSIHVQIRSTGQNVNMEMWEVTQLGQGNKEGFSGERQRDCAGTTCTP